MRGLALFAIGAVFGGAAGFLGAASQGVTLDGHDHGDPAQHGGAAHDALLEVAAEDAPALRIALTPDPVAGYTLQVMTERFTFAPESAGLAHVPGEGHAHVYVDGHKVARLYGPWMHLDGVPDEAARVEVTLNANDHRVYAVAGQPVTAGAALEP